MANKSLMNIAYEVLTQAYLDNGNKSVPMNFGDLLLAVGKEAGMEDERELEKIASRFYTDLTLDGRFVIKGENTWVLREHELYKDVHIDMNDAYKEVDEDEDHGDNAEEDESDGEEENRPHNDDEEEELGEEHEDDDLSLDDEDDDN